MNRLSLVGLLVVPWVVVACSTDATRSPELRDSGTTREAAAPHDAAKPVPDAHRAHDASPKPVPDASPVPEAAVEAGPDATAEASSGPPLDYPRLLSRTGLYSDIKTEKLAPGVRAFQPRYVLWSDGATKRRWIYLPDGEQIDTSDMDFWSYPIGTTAWKEFTRGGTRVETRMLRKNGPKPSDWTMIAYQWRSDMTDAVAVPNGVPDASGTEHDIPSQANCHFCHGNMKDVLLGVTAIQLSHSTALAGLRIDDLITEGRLSAPPPAPYQLPGTAVEASALGYLHANCGMCHNTQSAVSHTTPLRLWESTTLLDTVEHTLGYSTTVLRKNQFLPDLHVIEPRRPDDSELVIRISERGPRQMPPLATKIVDPTGISAIRAWVDSMPTAAVPEAGIPDSGFRDAGRGDARD